MTRTHVNYLFDPETRKIPLKPELIQSSQGLPAETNEQFAVMICSDKITEDYAPDLFNVTQFLKLLYSLTQPLSGIISNLV